jgi:hypothetical protein
MIGCLFMSSGKRVKAPRDGSWFVNAGINVLIAWFGGSLLGLICLWRDLKLRGFESFLYLLAMSVFVLGTTMPALWWWATRDWERWQQRRR